MILSEFAKSEPSNNTFTVSRWRARAVRKYVKRNPLLGYSQLPSWRIYKGVTFIIYGPKADVDACAYALWLKNYQLTAGDVIRESV